MPRPRQPSRCPQARRCLSAISTATGSPDLLIAWRSEHQYDGLVSLATVMALFQTPIVETVGFPVHEDAQLADMNGDGILDLVASNSSTGSIERYCSEMETARSNSPAVIRDESWRRRPLCHC